MTQRFYMGSLLLITTLSCWLVWHYVFSFQLEPPSNPNFSNAFVNGLTVTVMGPLGKREYVFNSPHMVHYEKGNRTQFELPTLTLYEENQSPWLASADHGEAVDGNTTVRLWSNVVLTQARSMHNLPTTVTTSKAILYTGPRIIETDQFISAVQPLTHVDSKGMRLDLTKQTLDLFSQVHGTYAQSP